MEEKNLYSSPEANLEQSAEEEVHQLASRWARVGASLVDTLIMLVVLVPIMFFTGYIEAAQTDSVSTSQTLLYGLVGLITYLVINGYLLANEGQTVGKKLIGTRIVSHETNELVSFGTVFGLRYVPVAIVANIPVIGPFLSIVDSLFAFRGDKRCIHDLIAGTHVIKAVPSTAKDETQAEEA